MLHTPMFPLNVCFLSKASRTWIWHCVPQLISYAFFSLDIPTWSSFPHVWIGTSGHLNHHSSTSLLYRFSKLTANKKCYTLAMLRYVKDDHIPRHPNKSNLQRKRRFINNCTRKTSIVQDNLRQISMPSHPEENVAKSSPQSE